MEELKEILGIASVVLVSVLVLRLAIKGTHKCRQLLNKQKAKEDAERKPTNCVGVIHPAQVFIDDKPLEGSDSGSSWSD